MNENRGHDVNNRFLFVIRLCSISMAYWCNPSSHFTIDVVPIVTELLFIVKQGTCRTNEGNDGVVLVTVVKNLKRDNDVNFLIILITACNTCT
jgi:hypothetical protein